ncbi:unnamed protein product [Miscanthus lutarioriparius]|uniref:Uncharacterized protein n=1 Tax=Miscanthus lutarioriparius TaxID=422564 RepID=A0A811PBW6_9POAL|nr:unnamed protein product [Miscanthus lutarioriparius]
MGLAACRLPPGASGSPPSGGLGAGELAGGSARSGPHRGGGRDWRAATVVCRCKSAETSDKSAVRVGLTNSMDG